MLELYDYLETCPECYRAIDSSLGTAASVINNLERGSRNGDAQVSNLAAGERSAATGIPCTCEVLRRTWCDVIDDKWLSHGADITPRDRRTFRHASGDSTGLCKCPGCVMGQLMVLSYDSARVLVCENRTWEPYNDMCGGARSWSRLQMRNSTERTDFLDRFRLTSVFLWLC